MQQVLVGIFKLPGLTFTKDEMSDELRDEMVEWAEQTNCGIFMNDRLWSFMDEGDFFILRWSDQVSNSKKS